jgi:hypothetical protein
MMSGILSPDELKVLAGKGARPTIIRWQKVDAQERATTFFILCTGPIPGQELGRACIGVCSSGSESVGSDESEPCEPSVRT